MDFRRDMRVPRTCNLFYRMSIRISVYATILLGLFLCPTNHSQPLDCQFRLNHVAYVTVTLFGNGISLFTRIDIGATASSGMKDA